MVVAENLGNLQGDCHLDADYRAAGGEAKLTSDPQKDVPSLPASLGQGFVLLVGTSVAAG